MRKLIQSEHLNTPRVITDSDGNVVWQWGGEPFGNTPPQAEVTGAGPFTFNLRFPGQYYDAETGLHYNAHRNYDPSTGRYVESDPTGLNAGPNTYGYVKGNPLDQADPLGLDPCAINLDQLIDNAISGATDAGTGKLRTKSNHNCATTVRNDLVGAGGPRLPPLGRNADGVANTPTNSAWGSTLVNGCYQLVTDPASYIPQKGDIAITEGIGTGHISIYDGSTWDADFASPNAAPGSTGAYKGSVATIYQYVGNK